MKANFIVIPILAVAVLTTDSFGEETAITEFCSFSSFPSIERLATQNENIVVGTIEAVDGEIVEVSWLEPDAEFQLRALESAEFLIDGSLKGDITAERIELSFDTKLVQTSCGDSFLGFEPSHRMILMLGPADEDGRYTAPLV